MKKESAECPHNRDRRSCWQCEGASICEHNRILRQCKQCMGPGLAICEHSLIRSACKLCKNSSICEHTEGGGAGGELLKDKRQKEAKHKQEGVQGKGKG